MHANLTEMFTVRKWPPNLGEVEVQLVAVLVQPAALAHLWLWQPAPARCKSVCPLGCVCVHMCDA